MNNLDNNEIDLVNGAIGNFPSDPTFQDYIDLAEQTAEDTLRRLTDGGGLGVLPN